MTTLRPTAFATAAIMPIAVVAYYTLGLAFSSHDSPPRDGPADLLVVTPSHDVSSAELDIRGQDRQEVRQPMHLEQRDSARTGETPAHQHPASMRESISESLARLGRHLDGSEYVQAKYILSEDGLESLLATESYNPRAPNVTEQERQGVLTLIRSAEAHLKPLRDARRELEQRVILDMLAGGEAEKAIIVDGKRTNPTPEGPEERVIAVMSGGQSGFVRLRPGLSLERDALLFHECTEMAALEERIRAFLLAGQGGKTGR